MKYPAENLWRAVTHRDPRFDRDFVFAVRSTGVYCRPSCPARRPRRQNVVFFPGPAAAEQAGFRACRRCRPGETSHPQAALVTRLCRQIEQEPEHVRLDDLARAAGLSPAHLLRVFRRVLGVSPRQYAEARRLARLKARLRQGDDVTGALYAAGFSSSSRLYERAPESLGMTPATYRNGAAGERIAYALAPSPLGRLLVAATARGVCAVKFGDRERALVRALAREFPAAELRRDPGPLAQALRQFTAYFHGRLARFDLPLDLRATAFQCRVWEALRAIPRGATRSYRQVAAAIGRPQAVRAVARACATNPVAVVIPCHRVLRSDGGLGGYRWGRERKQALLKKESSI